jgi:hypothetical protein
MGVKEKVVVHTKRDLAERRYEEVCRHACFHDLS